MRAVGPDLVAPLGWTPGAARVRLELRAEKRRQGCPPQGVIRCEVADEGALVADGPLLAAVPLALGPQSGCAGGDCLDSWIERVHEAHVALGLGRITLRAASRVCISMDLVGMMP